MLTLASWLLLPRHANLACGSAQSFCPPLFWSRMWLFLDGEDRRVFRRRWPQISLGSPA